METRRSTEAPKIELETLLILEAVVVVFFYNLVLDLTDKAIQQQSQIVNLSAVKTLCCVSIWLLTNRDQGIAHFQRTWCICLHSPVALGGTSPSAKRHL